MIVLISTNKVYFQLTVDTVTSEIGQNVLLNVEEELRLGLEPAQTPLLRTEELTVSGPVVKPKNAILKDAQVRYGRT